MGLKLLLPGLSTKWCMSEPAEEPYSSEASTGLQEEVRELTRALGLLTERVSALEQERESSEVRSASYSVVTAAGSQAAALPAASASYTGAPLVAQAKAVSGPPAVQTWGERESIAADIGRWLRASLEGQHRGNSGRDRIVLSSRLYIVIRDHSGLTTTDPVRVFSRFSEVREICFRGHWGDSIFVGLPSQREAIACLRAGGFSAPPRFP